MFLAHFLGNKEKFYISPTNLKTRKSYVLFSKETHIRVSAKRSENKKKQLFFVF